VRWMGKDEWQALRLFPEYRRALEVYFKNVWSLTTSKPLKIQS
jgi:hypothetical protein